MGEVDKWVVGVNSVNQIEAALSSVSEENLEPLFAYLSQQSRVGTALCFDQNYGMIISVKI